MQAGNVWVTSGVTWRKTTSDYNHPRERKCKKEKNVFFDLKGGRFLSTQKRRKREKQFYQGHFLFCVSWSLAWHVWTRRSPHHHHHHHQILRTLIFPLPDNTHKIWQVKLLSLKKNWPHTWLVLLFSFFFFFMTDAILGLQLQSESKSFPQGTVGSSCLVSPHALSIYVRLPPKCLYHRFITEF